MTNDPLVENGAAASDEERALWAAWRASGDPAARQALVVRYLPNARMIAARLFRQRGASGVEFEEYYQLACIGLLEALDRFDETLGPSFEAFSQARIEGNVLNGLGKLTEIGEQLGLRKRLRRERVASLKTAQAAELRTARETLAYLSEVAVGLAIGFMLEESALYRAGEADTAADSVYDSAAWRQTRARVVAALDGLPERENQIIVLHYFHFLGFEEIGAIFGLTKGRISQIHRGALERLRSLLGTAEQFHMTK
jgi:RNA polymerase sigma factor for flagellar operon FliA